MNRNKFSGSKPVSVLNFLASYKTSPDHEFIPEVVGHRVMSNFFEGDALTLYETMSNDAGTESPGFISWTHAVQLLLETYCTDLNIEKAVDDLERIRLEPKESISQFKTRLTRAHRELADAHTHDALITRFVRNFPASIRDIVRLELTKYRRANAFYGAAALTKIAAFAEAHYKAIPQAPAPSCTPRFRVDPVNQVNGIPVVEDQREEQPRSRDYDLPIYQDSAQHRASMHPNIAAVNGSRNSDYAPTTRTGYTPSLEYSFRGDDGAPLYPYANRDTVMEAAQNAVALAVEATPEDSRLARQRWITRTRLSRAPS